MLVGEMVDAFDDADADETAVAVADDTAVAVALLVGKKVADADATAVAEGVEREE